MARHLAAAAAAVAGRQRDRGQEAVVRGTYTGTAVHRESRGLVIVWRRTRDQASPAFDLGVV